MDNSIILIIGGVLLGIIVGFIIAKALERNNASKLIKSAKKFDLIMSTCSNEDGLCIIYILGL